MCHLIGCYLAPTSLIIPHVLPLQVPKKIFHKDLPILHSASNSSVVSTERNVKLSKMSYSFLCPSLCQALHPFYSNHSLPQMCGSKSFAEAVYVPCYVHVFTTSVGRCVVFLGVFSYFSPSGYSSILLSFKSILK